MKPLCRRSRHLPLQGRLVLSVLFPLQGGMSRNDNGVTKTVRPNRAHGFAVFNMRYFPAAAISRFFWAFASMSLMRFS